MNVSSLQLLDYFQHAQDIFHSLGVKLDVDEIPRLVRGIVW